jgi:hypothetical protein
MSEMILCVPGPWKDRAELLGKIIAVEPEGRYMYAGLLLADVQAKEHVPLEFGEADPDLAQAFEFAGQGKIPEAVLEQVRAHMSVVYLRFPIALAQERERVLKFGTVLQRAGGVAIKVESAGIAHTWERWSELLNGTPFDLYCAVVVLVADEEQYHSCGMHHFLLPECAVPRSMPLPDAAELMNQVNFWRMLETPALANGHTFSLTASSPRYRMTLEPDQRHANDDPFHNEHGVWNLRDV